MLCTLFWTPKKPLKFAQNLNEKNVVFGANITDSRGEKFREIPSGIRDMTLFGPPKTRFFGQKSQKSVWFLKSRILEGILTNFSPLESVTKVENGLIGLSGGKSPWYLPPKNRIFFIEKKKKSCTPGHFFQKCDFGRKTI